MKSSILIGSFLTITNIISAQTFDYSIKDQWANVPQKHTINQDFSAASAVGILDDRNIEFKVEGKDLVLLTKYHNIIRINDDKGIEMYNKVFVPMYGGADITDLKARTVLANGKVIDIPASKIKETEEEGRKYKLFAMEGVEKGSEIEYSYTIKKSANFFGMELYQTAPIPYQQVYFSLTVPEHLKFDAKGYNGFKVSKDSLIAGKRIIVGYDTNVPEIDEEKYAVRDPYLERVEYKLSYNLSGSTDVRLYTWKEFAKKAYAIYTTVTPKDEKAAAAFVSQIKIDKSKAEEDKIVAIEDHVKSTINLDKGLISDDGSLIEKIVKSKSANNQGILRLFTTIFEKEAINYQIVFVGRRDEFALDEDIENWNRIEDVVFYFPATKKYLSPFSIELRYPYIPAYWAESKGLFLKGTTIGSFKTAVGSFATIEMEPYENHAHNMEVSLEFDSSLDTLLIQSKQILKGYGASAYRPIYTFLPKDKQDEANIEIMKDVAKSKDIKNIKIENTKLTDLVDNKPLIISGDIKSTELVERAGNKVLLKIGEIIGTQVEMYQEKPRRLPIELAYPHVLHRKIILKLPQGYKVKNLTDLNLSIQHKEGEDLTIGFVSNYQQAGSVVTIDVTESYKRLHYPLSHLRTLKR